jgi:3-oxoacyl-(acyl-carrier-protein) synthase
VSEPAILAASHLGPDGYANPRSGLRPWPAELAGELRQGNLARLHWSTLFNSDSQRFARMDLMSRLGLMAVELLDAGIDAMPEAERDRVGVCLETRTGCLATDLEFLRGPRPSVFPYTLPSTVVGEVCIRHRLRGPVLCLLTPPPPARAAGAVREAASWIRDGEASHVLCLGVEAMDGASRALLAELGSPDAGPWEAAALWLGSADGARGARAPGSGSVTGLARRCVGA